jgi:hypothetical protein
VFFCGCGESGNITQLNEPSILFLRLPTRLSVVHAHLACLLHVLLLHHPPSSILRKQTTSRTMRSSELYLGHPELMTEDEQEESDFVDAQAEVGTYPRIMPRS